MWRGKGFGFQSAVSDRQPQRRSDNGQLPRMAWECGSEIPGNRVDELSSNGGHGCPPAGHGWVIGFLGGSLYLWVCT